MKVASLLLMSGTCLAATQTAMHIIMDCDADDRCEPRVMISNERADADAQLKALMGDRMQSSSSAQQKESLKTFVSCADRIQMIKSDEKDEKDEIERVNKLFEDEKNAWKPLDVVCDLKQPVPLEPKKKMAQKDDGSKKKLIEGDEKKQQKSVIKPNLAQNESKSPKEKESEKSEKKSDRKAKGKKQELKKEKKESDSKVSDVKNEKMKESSKESDQKEKGEKVVGKKESNKEKKEKKNVPKEESKKEKKEADSNVSDKKTVGKDKENDQKESVKKVSQKEDSKKDPVEGRKEKSLKSPKKQELKSSKQDAKNDENKSKMESIEQKEKKSSKKENPLLKKNEIQRSKKDLLKKDEIQQSKKDPLEKDEIKEPLEENQEIIKTIIDADELLEDKEIRVILKDRIYQLFKAIKALLNPSNPEKKQKTDSKPIEKPLTNFVNDTSTAAIPSETKSSSSVPLNKADENESNAAEIIKHKLTYLKSKCEKEKGQLELLLLQLQK